MSKILKSITFQRNNLAVRTGLEPATSCVTGRHSNQLNYRTRVFCASKITFITLTPVKITFINCVSKIAIIKLPIAKMKMTHTGFEPVLPP
jgi:hypothetical protein